MGPVSDKTSINLNCRHLHHSAIKMNNFILATLCASALFGVSDANACGLISAVGGPEAINGIMQKCGGPDCNLENGNACSLDAEHSICTVAWVSMVAGKMGITVEQAAAEFGVSMDQVEASMTGDQAAAGKIMAAVVSGVAACA